jgi:hypothetical protein
VDLATSNQSRAERYYEFTITVAVEPTDWSCIATPLERFVPTNEFER